MAIDYDKLTADQKLRWKALGGGLRSSFHNLHACYSSTDSVDFFTAAECNVLSEAEALVLQVILSARTRGAAV